MATKVIMPKQGLQMTEGTILKWLVPEGGMCKEGEPLFEIETDKLNITLDAPATGKLLKIVHDEGDVVEITKLIAVIGEEGEDISGLLAGEAGEAPPEQKSVPAPQKAPQADRIFATPRAKMRAEESGIAVGDVAGSGPEGLVVERDVLTAAQNLTKNATPLAQKVAELEKVDIIDIEGSGAGGKVVKDDILKKAAERAAQKAAQAEGAAPRRAEKLVKLTGMRRAVAKNMKISQNANAQTTHQVKVDMTNAIQMRETYQKFGQKISFNDIVLRATAKALTEFPMMNSEWTDQGILVKEYVNLGMAVALKEGLIVPNIKNADCMTVAEISEVAKALAGKAREGKLTLEEYSGGTFTVSNMGMFGIDNFVAIINPPEAGILAVGKLEETPVVIDHQICIRPIMVLTLSYDHRIVDGAPAAEFIVRIKQLMENPCLML